MIIEAEFPFKGVDTTWLMITALDPDSVVVAVVHKLLSLNLYGSAYHWLSNLMFEEIQLSVL